MPQPCSPQPLHNHALLHTSQDAALAETMTGLFAAKAELAEKELLEKEALAKLEVEEDE